MFQEKNTIFTFTALVLKEHKVNNSLKDLDVTFLRILLLSYLIVFFLVCFLKKSFFLHSNYQSLKLSEFVSFHMLQLFCFEWEVLSFWEDSSRIPISSWNLPFWDEPSLNIRCLWILRVNHTFYKLDGNILTASNEIGCAHYSWLPSSSWAIDLCQKSMNCFDTNKNTRNQFENLHSL